MVLGLKGRRMVQLWLGFSLCMSLVGTAMVFISIGQRLGILQ